MKFFGFLNDYSGLLMVIITAIYVVATIKIYIENKKSVIASKKQLIASENQLKESKNQFKESQRLSCQPFLQIEKVSILPGDNSFSIYLPIYYDESEDFKKKGCRRFYFVLKNLGNGNAINLLYSWEDSNNQDNEYSYPPINAIMHGDTYGIDLKIDPDIQGKVVLIFHYDDLIGYHYYQKVFLTINGDKIKYENDKPCSDGKF